MASLEFMRRHLNLSNKTGIMSAEPLLNIIAELFCQCYHFFGFLFSDQPGSFIVANITFLTELV
ncbi:MAG: hypothetical protein ACOC7P_00780 [Chloroflexota bacterium]